MNQSGLFRHVAVAFGIALLIYVVFYAGIERQRTHKGPWQVAFERNPAGSPVIFINQPMLGITNVQIIFSATSSPTNFLPSTLVFDQPLPTPYDVPFGKCIFMDPTFLPGTITFELFGHQIQLIPRTLTIDKKEFPWRSNISIPLTVTNSAGSV